MPPKHRETARSRLKALARQRRLQAGEERMSESMRARLQQEVRRVHQGEAAGEVPSGGAAAERSSAVERGGRGEEKGRTRWGAWLAWAAVGAAAVSLGVVVFLPDPRTRVAAVEERARESRPTPDSVAPFTAIPEMPDALGGQDSSASARAGVATTGTALGSPAGTIAAGEAAPAAARSAPGAERLGVRVSAPTEYQAAPESGAPDFLRRFEVTRQGDRVELRAADGSIFTGRVTALERGGNGGGGWSYEARGVARGSGREAWITGNFAGGMGGAGSDALGALSATVQFAGGGSFEIRAAPVTGTPQGDPVGDDPGR